MSTELVRQVAGVSLATQRHYIIKRKFWSMFERVFRVWTADGQLIMYIKHPIFRLRDEFQIYADEQQTRALFRIKAEQVIAINYTYSIFDLQTGELVGSVERKGLRSLVRDRFIIHDAAGVPIGHGEEQGASVLRRFIPWLLSQHTIFVDEQPAAMIRQRFRFFTKEFEVDLQPSKLAPPFVLAVALLALMSEVGREDG
jgi:uncharacterized protein YxjI